MKNIYAAFRRRPFRILFALAWLAATPLAATPPCADTLFAPLGDDLRAYEVAGGEMTLFDVEVPAAGVLLVEASSLLGAEADTRLALFDDECRPATVEDTRVVARWISGLVLEIGSPGTYRFAVASQDPDAALAEVVFTSRFLETATRCDDAALKTVVDPELDPDAVSSCGARTVVDPELDPDLTVVDPELDPDLTVVDPELDPDLLRASLEPTLCARRPGDDHADVLACATPVEPGHRVLSDLGWGDDVDVLTFELEEQRTVSVSTVAVEATGAGTAHGALYDGSGHRLADDDGTDGLRLVRTLAPGRYYVRLAGDGHHAVTVNSWSW